MNEETGGSKQETKLYLSKNRKKDNKKVLFTVLAICLIYIVGRFVQDTTWYRKMSGQFIELGSTYDGKDQFQQEKKALLALVEKCKLSKDAKVLLEGIVPGVSFNLNKDGNAIGPFPEAHTIYVYDKGKEYRFQYLEDYDVSIWDSVVSQKDLEAEKYYNLYEYIGMLEYYDSSVASKLDYPYYHVEYMPYEHIEKTLKMDEAKLYLYQDGQYEEVKEIPVGDYAYYDFVGSDSQNRFTREEGTYGYLLIKR